MAACHFPLQTSDGADTEPTAMTGSGGTVR